MRFDEYYKIMKEHGICEFFFSYDGNDCSIMMDIQDFALNYSISFGSSFYESNDFDDIVSLKFLSIGKTLEDIWDQIEIDSIDGVSEDEYDYQTCSYNFVERLNQLGEPQWTYYLGAKESFFLRLKYASIGVLVLPVLSILLPLFNLVNWNFLFFTGGCAAFALIIVVIVLLNNRMAINYCITTKRILVFKGIDLETTYDNVRKVKLKKSFFKKNYGTVKIYLRKGFSFNYHLENIPDPEEVYNLILKNIFKTADNA